MAFTTNSQPAILGNEPVIDIADSDTDEEHDSRRAIIIAVKDRPHLYDTNRIDYLDPTMCKTAFAEIGSQLNMTGKEVEKRWEALVDRFVLKKSLIESPVKWKAKSALLDKFPDDEIDNLDDTSEDDADDCETAKSITSEQSSSDEFTDEEMSEYSLLSIDTSGPPQSSSDEFTDEEMSEYSLPSIDNSGPPLKRQSTMNDYIINVTKNVNQTTKSKLDRQAKQSKLTVGELAFGTSVSLRLKQLSREQSSLAQLRILQLLHEIEFGESAND